jgi:hypothetical protein
VDTLKLLYDAVRAHLADYLRLTDPEAAPYLELASLTFLPDFEDQPLSPTTYILVADVPSRPEPITIFVAFCAKDPNREQIRQLGHEVHKLANTYRQPVLAGLLLLGGSRSGLSTWKVMLEDDSSVYFTTLNLATSSAEDHLARREPLSWALAAFMRSRTGKDLREISRLRLASLSLREDLRSLLLSLIEAAPTPLPHRTLPTQEDEAIENTLRQMRAIGCCRNPQGGCFRSYGVCYCSCPRCLCATTVLQVEERRALVSRFLPELGHAVIVELAEEGLEAREIVALIAPGKVWHPDSPAAWLSIPDLQPADAPRRRKATIG